MRVIKGEYWEDALSLLRGMFRGLLAHRVARHTVIVGVRENGRRGARALFPVAFPSGCGSLERPMGRVHVLSAGRRCDDPI